MKTKLYIAAFAALWSACVMTGSVHAQSWNITGNAGTTVSHFLGTTDNVSLRFRTNNVARMIITSSGNVGIGTTSPSQKLHVSGGSIQITTGNLTLTSGTISVTGGSINTGTDFRVGTTRVLAITGSQNLFVGRGSGSVNTGFGNTFLGDSAGVFNTSGNDNVFIGRLAGKSNTTQTGNVYVGPHTGKNCTGSANTLLGNSAGAVMRNVFNNTLIGNNAGANDTSGAQNTFIGSASGVNHLSGFDNTYVGYGSGFLAITTSGNTCIGAQAGLSDATGSNNTYLGKSANCSGTVSNATALGNGATVNASNKVRVGNSSVTVIEGQVNFSASSDARLKTNVNDYDLGMEFIKKLRPVSYHFRQGDTQTEHHGFIAQEMEAALAGKNFDALNKPKNENDNYSIAYASLVVPLVNAAKELSAANEALQNRVAHLELLLGARTAETTPASMAAAATLEQNVPNPFGESTTLKVFVPQTVSAAVLNIYNAAGQQVKSISVSSKGSSAIIIDASGLADGNYTCTLLADGVVAQSKTMTIAAGR